jgi:hypothetical protein
METVTAIFDSRQAAEKSFSKLSASANFNRENLLLLTPARRKSIAFRQMRASSPARVLRSAVSLEVLWV